MIFDIAKLILYGIFAGVLPSLALIFHLSRDKGHIDLLDRLVMALVMSPLVLVLVSFLEEVPGVPQNRLVLTINLVALALINIFLLIKYFRGKPLHLFNFSWGKLVFLLLFLLVIVYRLLPTEALATPILHDPIAHSEWLKQLNITHFTTKEKWYPQGLEYYLNYFATYFDISYPKIVLIWTNFFTALFPVGFFYMGMLLVKKPGKYYLLYPMVLFTLAAIARVPTNFYFLAGKNSLIFVFSAAPIILYAIYAARSKLDHLISAMLIGAAIVIHYPTGFSLLVFYSSMSLLGMISWRRWRVKVDRQALYGFLSGVSALFVFGMILTYRVLPIYRGYPPENDKSIGAVLTFIDKFGVIKYISDDFYSREVSLIGTMAVILFTAALAVFLFAANGKKYRRFTGYFLFSYIVLSLVGAIILLFPDKVQGVFLGFQIQFFFIFVQIVLVAWLVMYIFSRWSPASPALIYGISVFVLAALVIYMGANQYHRYLEEQEKLKTTTAADLEAFRFINTEIGDNKKFLIQLATTINVVMGTDSGVWIPSFTDKQVEVDFTDYNNPKSYEIFNLYAEIARNGSDEEAIRRLHCDYGVGYIFFGSRKVFSDNMQKEVLDGSGYFRKIFDNGASIYKIEAPVCG